MKKIISLLVLLIITTTLLAQQMPKDATTNRFVYEDVVHLDSVKSAQIFISAKEWLVRNLKSSDNNVNLGDKESNTLTATGNIHLQNRIGWCAYNDINLNFKFSVFIKDGRYKYIVENFYYSYRQLCDNGSNSPVSGPFEQLNFGKSKNDKVYEEANTKILSLINELNIFVKSRATNKDNDW